MQVEPQPSKSAHPASSNERLLAEAARIAGVGGWEWNVLTNECWWSDQALAFAGVGADAPPTLSQFLSYVHPDDRARLVATLEGCLAGACRYAIEFRLVRPGDGRVLICKAAGELFTDDDGRPLRIAGVFQDVTESANAVEQLRASEERFRIVARATDDVLWDCDLTSRWWSESLGLLGYAAQKTTVDFWVDRVHPEDRAATVESLDAALAGTGTKWFHEYRFRRLDGSYTDMLDRGYIVRDASGKAVRAMGAMQDISARKEAERKNGLLKQLEEANRQLAEFAYVVSHDLKAPLRGISSLTEWIVRDSGDRLDEDGRQQLDLLRTRVGRMNALIDGILAYSRVGRAGATLSKVNLAEVVPQIIDLVAPPPHVVFDVEGTLPVVFAARTQIAQVFQNLLSNAVTFCDSTRGRVVIRGSDVGDAWRFDVEDNGEGIDKRHHDRIFQLFQTLASRDRAGGTGIGLSNRAFCAMSGYAQHELVGRTASAFGLPGNAGENASYDLVATTKEGTELRLALTCSRVHDAAGRVIGTVRVTRDMTESYCAAQKLRDAYAELERSRAALADLVVRDELTGLFNRRELFRVLGEAVEAARSGRAPVSLVILDVDHFKRVNDRYGHPAGDEVLRRVSAVIKREVRSSDVAARFGGEEFAIVLRGTAPAGARVFAERLRAALAAELVRAGGQTIAITASFGVASTDGGASTETALVESADAALYRAKSAGRNCVGPWVVRLAA